LEQPNRLYPLTHPNKDEPWGWDQLDCTFERPAGEYPAVSPKVSIIIPCYNARETIAEAVRSALDQTHQSLEVIVVDDASKDGTPELLRQLSLSDPRIQVIYLTQNAGPSAARNIAIREARGEWLALLDADDIYEPDRIRTLLEVALTQQADMVADNILMEEYPRGGNRAIAFPFNQAANPIELTLLSFLASTVQNGELNFGFLKPLIKRSFLVKEGLSFSTKYRVGEDFLLFTECLLRGARLLILPKPGYIYRRRKDSITVSGRYNNSILSELNGELMERLRGNVNAAEWDALIAYQCLLDQTVEYDKFRSSLSSGSYWRAILELLSSPFMIRIAFRRLRIRARRFTRNRNHA